MRRRTDGTTRALPAKVGIARGTCPLTGNMFGKSEYGEKTFFSRFYRQTSGKARVRSTVTGNVVQVREYLGLTGKRRERLGKQETGKFYGK
jgi:hypothetical protein